MLRSEGEKLRENREKTLFFLIFVYFSSVLRAVFKGLLHIQFLQYPTFTRPSIPPIFPPSLPPSSSIPHFSLPSTFSPPLPPLISVLTQHSRYSDLCRHLCTNKGAYHKGKQVKAAMHIFVYSKSSFLHLFFPTSFIHLPSFIRFIVFE